MNEKSIEDEILILKEAVANISKENKKLKEWIYRALDVKSAITHGNIKKLTLIKRLVYWIYKWMKNEDLEELYRCKSRMKEIKETLGNIDLY